MTDDDLYVRAYELVDRNEMIYNVWESYIAKRMAKKWPEAFASLDSEWPTVLEVASMCADEISDHESFLETLRRILKALAQGNQLDGEGNWQS
jgi:hypothetical protein